MFNETILYEKSCSICQFIQGPIELPNTRLILEDC